MKIDLYFQIPAVGSRISFRSTTSPLRPLCPMAQPLARAQSPLPPGSFDFSQPYAHDTADKLEKLDLGDVAPSQVTEKGPMSGPGAEEESDAYGGYADYRASEHAGEKSRVLSVSGHDGAVRNSTGQGLPRPESRYDSAETAEDIFDLYERDRDSWTSGVSGVGAAAQQIRYSVDDERQVGSARRSSNYGSTAPAPSAAPYGNGNGLSLGPCVDDRGEEVLDATPPSTPRQRQYTPYASSTSSPRVVVNPDQSLQSAGSPSTAFSTPTTTTTRTNSNITSPVERYTPNTSSALRHSTHSIDESTESGNTMLGSPSQVGGLSPLSARQGPRGSDVGVGPSGYNSPSRVGKGKGSKGPLNASQVSVAASSQYPGEEDDAFYVRSTCESSEFGSSLMSPC